jgi:uncharacterized membrane protein YhhN
MSNINHPYTNDQADFKVQELPMPYHLIPVPIILILIVLYKIFRDRNDLKKIAIIQPLITCLSILICLLSFLTSGFKLSYTLLILLGLSLSVVADFILVDVKDMKKLVRALILFLLIYIAYSLAITLSTNFLITDLYSAAGLLVVIVACMAILWKGLQGLKIPVLVYVVLLCFFIDRAISTFSSPNFSLTQSILVTAAASMFFIGDLELAYSSFKKPILLYIGPVTYALSQMLMALSACYFLR